MNVTTMDYYLAIKREEWLEKGLAVEGIAALADPDLTPSTQGASQQSASPAQAAALHMCTDRMTEHSSIQTTTTLQSRVVLGVLVMVPVERSWTQ